MIYLWAGRLMRPFVLSRPSNSLYVTMFLIYFVPSFSLSSSLLTPFRSPQDAHGEVCPANWTEGSKTMKPEPKASLEYFESVGGLGDHANGISATDGTNGHAEGGAKKRARLD